MWIYGAFVAAKEVYGNLPPMELMAKLDHDYLVHSGAHVRFFNSEGKFALKRSPLNKRGDKSSIDARQLSVESVGVLQDLRGGAFLHQIDNPSGSGGAASEDYGVLHFATLCEGVEAAALADPEKRNKCVQMSIANGLKGVKIYSRMMPAWGKVFLVDYGNSLNGDATITTILEKWRGTAATPLANNMCSDIMIWISTNPTKKQYVYLFHLFMYVCIQKHIQVFCIWVYS